MIKDLINTSEAATKDVLWKKVLLEIPQNSEANICARISFLIKLQASGLQRLWYNCLPVNFAKIFGTPFLQNTSGRLLLYLSL